MKSIVDFLDSDKEIQEMRKRWVEVFGKFLPPYNYDEYAGIEDYKAKLRKRLEDAEKK